MSLCLVWIALALADDDVEAAWGGGGTKPAEEEEPEEEGGWSGSPSTPPPTPPATPTPPAPAVPATPPAVPPPTPPAVPPPTPPAVPPPVAPKAATPPPAAPKAAAPAAPNPSAPAAVPIAGEPSDEEGLPPDLLGQAVEAPPVDAEQLDWLKPKLGSMPPVVRAHTDYSAFTLEWGEVRIGLVNTQVGVLPRTQLGTNIPLDILGLYNLNGKVNPLRLGPWDLSLNANHIRLVQPEFHTAVTVIGTTNSFTFNEHFSLHLGLSAWRVRMEGYPDLAAIHPALLIDAETYAQTNDPIDFGVGALTGRAALEVRFNRRDSLVLQAESAFHASPISPELPDLPPFEVLTTLARSEGFVPLNSAYNASISYQADLRRLSVRVGVGRSSTPYAWLLKAVDVSYRFGGPTKVDERRQRSAWRRTKRERSEAP